MADVQPPPLRALDDFLLGSARFSVPDVKNLERWNNRIINNLLYYQSNYFASAAIFLVIVGYFRPLQLLLGALVVALVFLGFVGCGEPGRSPPFPPHSPGPLPLCHPGRGLPAAVCARGRGRLPVWDCLPDPTDPDPRLGASAQSEEQAGEQAGEHRAEEDPHGAAPGGSGAGAGGWLLGPGASQSTEEETGSTDRLLEVLAQN
ncbi:hypothetical protein ANANG_G00254970 [Anguilla anguilla]|uniref:PRA1 family protein n=1 Tax=Anguilla anguilla TaxID=7936 RepID=A0A9D3RN00_ANGAN|nr:hypothetical protein ANANG_G00254970 [Anguilla anguilla]